MDLGMDLGMYRHTSVRLYVQKPITGIYSRIKNNIIKN